MSATLGAAIARVDAAAQSLSASAGCDAILVPGASAQLVRFHADLLALGRHDVRGAVVVDAGCGPGASSIAMAALGARVVHAVDVDADKIAALERCRPVLGALGDAVRPVRGSVFALPLEAESVDLVVSIEAIGVYRDVGAFLDECARVLRPGGAVVMAEINDVLNRRLRARARRLWRAYELGPPGVHDGHTIGRSYRDQRADLIRELLPDAPADAVDRLAANTFGHDADAVRAACERWAATGEEPASPYVPDRAPMDLDGLLVEARVEPGWMRAALNSRGLGCDVVGFWGGTGGNAAVRAANRGLQALGPLALPTARAVRYVGRRDA